MKIIKLLKENWLYILIVIVSCFLFLFPLPYTIEGPGGLIAVKDRFQIENSNRDMQYYLAYVSEYKATPITYLHAKLHKNYEIIPKSEQVGTDKEMNFRNHLMLEEANQDALIYAYTKAGKKVDILEEEIYVTMIDTLAKTDLEVGDRIESINKEKVKNKEHLFSLIQSSSEKVKLEVEKNGKRKEKYALLLDIEGTKKIGILPTVKRKIRVEPEIEFIFDKSESGASGGFMMTLAIYDALTNSNFSKNKKIAGTGTIDGEGNIGEIGGIKYKILGALEEKADLFFVPKENYEEALQTLKENKGDLKLIKVEHFEEVLDFLKKD
jgi:PDZ domain-containing protein